MTKQTHPFHMVDQSPWPIMASFSALMMTSGLALWFHSTSTKMLMTLGLVITIVTSIQWWRDITRESTLQGHHTSSVETGMRWGMILFIVSEICFFLAFFWSFFHSSLAPTPEIGTCWPPTGIAPMNAFSVPLLNTAILLSSGVTITWAHHALLAGDRKTMITGLGITITLGMYFTLLQAMEYMEATFTIADSTYGSTFFVATGFHGLHVLIGSTFLTVCLARQLLFHYSKSHHFGFEAAAWYWHFVDVVWLFLFVCMYWWGA
uniref:Cytochrome c oxidase subunit 3 n=1 Tax=Xenoturbella profunda TaxID=1736633 RepID=A0A0U2UE19_9BILA|nr:cytochrome c oxidase subunit III [Xenoturbella profunda]ALS20093.1 cytochrome c oxidase subunit III [Xenoturbella profunda]